MENATQNLAAELSNIQEEKNVSNVFNFCL